MRYLKTHNTGKRDITVLVNHNPSNIKIEVNLKNKAVNVTLPEIPQLKYH